MKLLWRNLLLLIFAIHSLGEQKIKSEKLAETTVGDDDYLFSSNESIKNSNPFATEIPSPVFYSAALPAALKDRYKGSREELSEQEDMILSSRINNFPDFQSRAFNEHVYDDYSGYGKPTPYY